MRRVDRSGSSSNYAIATLRGVAAAVLVVSVALTFRLRAKP